MKKKKQKQRRAVFIVAMLSVLLISAGTGIYAGSRLTFENRFGTGGVNISLKEYTVRDGKEELFAGECSALPGDVVSLIPRLSNDGPMECYVRVRLDAPENAAWLTESLIGLDDSWIRGDDGYLYQKNILGVFEQTDLFTGIQIPLDLPEDFSDQDLKLAITADAMQAANFSPDFESENPWGNVAVERSIKNADLEVRAIKSVRSGITVVYDEKTDSLRSQADDLFADMPLLMPGDVYSDSIHFENSGKDDCMIYFSTASESTSGTDVLDRAGLEISMDSGGEKSMIYSGTLKSTELQNSILLCTLKQNESALFEFSLSLPDDLDNDYSLISDSTVWIFSEKKLNREEVHELTVPPQTGDTNQSGLSLLIAGVLAAAAAVFFIRWWKRHPL